MLKEINRGAQFAAQRIDQRFQIALHFPGHANLDVFGFHVADAHRLRQPACKPITADADHPVQHHLAAVQNSNAGVFEPDIHQSDHFFGEDFRFRHFKGIHRPGQTGKNLIGDQPGRFAGGL